MHLHLTCIITCKDKLSIILVACLHLSLSLSLEVFWHPLKRNQFLSAPSFTLLERQNFLETVIHSDLSFPFNFPFCSEQVLHLWLEALCSCESIVEKWYYPSSFVRSPGWVQIKCELRVLSKFAFNLSTDWEIPTKKEVSRLLKFLFAVYWRVIFFYLCILSCGVSIFLLINISSPNFIWVFIELNSANSLHFIRTYKLNIELYNLVTIFSIK